MIMVCFCYYVSNQDSSHNIQVTIYRICLFDGNSPICKDVIKLKSLFFFIEWNSRFGLLHTSGLPGPGNHGDRTTFLSSRLV